MVVSEKKTDHTSFSFGSTELKEMLQKCYQCSSCASVCPLRRVSKFNPRKIILNFLFDIPLTEDDITTCLTCGNCLEVCPHLIDFPEFIRQARANNISEESYAHHNIFNLLQIFMVEMADTGMKFDYAGELNSESEIAYFPGCIDLFDRFLDLKETDFHQMGQSAINVINKAGVKPNLLSLKCCGHDSYWTGDEAVFEQVREFNTQAIKDSGISTLIVSCAECYYTFEKLYNLEGIKVQHLAHFIEEHQDKFQFKGEQSTLTYHDPCRLGRFMKEYSSPRAALEITGAKVQELPTNKHSAKCCGVSAWLRCDDSSRAIMLKKLEDAANTVGNDGLLAVACSKCFAHLNCVLEDKKPQHNLKIKVKDLGMIVDERTV
jgi:Fe-S oxidoreductase